MLDLDSGIGVGNMRKRAWFKTVMEQVHGDIAERNAPVFNLTQLDVPPIPLAPAMELDLLPMGWKIAAKARAGRVLAR
jgi:hypothetical protein